MHKPALNLLSNFYEKLKINLIAFFYVCQQCTTMKTTMKTVKITMLTNSVLYAYYLFIYLLFLLNILFIEQLEFRRSTNRMKVRL